MKRVYLNIFVGLLLGFISLSLLYISSNFPGTSKNFPMTMLLLIFLLSLFQIIISIYRFKTIKQNNFEIKKISLIIFCLTFVSIYLMQFLNFFGLFLLFFLSGIYFYRIKNLKFYLFGTLILFLSIYLVFEFGLNVSLINREFLG